MALTEPQKKAVRAMGAKGPFTKADTAAGVAGSIGLGAVSAKRMLEAPARKAAAMAAAKAAGKGRFSSLRGKLGFGSLLAQGGLQFLDALAGQPVAPQELYDALGVTGWVTAPAMMYGMNEIMGGNPAGNPELDYRAGDPYETYNRSQLLKDNSKILEATGRVLPLNSPRRMQILHSMSGGGARSIGNMVRPSATSMNPYQMDMAAPHQFGRDWEKYYAQVYGTGRE